ncbi:uncharacterized protein LOC126571758 [Anopheles aquasalis]|uniref:uncharacterized protein LOC126571758 n=1 Tax=Anopheles aquasalis TaxID=42839 RepID=UPI00215A9B5F|nr:uncharacterized protein LOC126571758 [Anopheles aquasalis]
MFLIVEIVNDKGEKDWKVAPKRWVCTSKNTQRPVLFWPDEFSAERQNQLAIEGTCKPLQSWMRRECVVKQEFPTYEAANTELQALLSQNSNQIKEELEDPLNVEDPTFESPESPCAPGSDEDVSTLASIKSMLQSLITKSAQIEKQNANILEQNSRITNEMSALEQRIKTMEQTVKEMASYKFDPMQTVDQLTELDKKLNDESFNVALVQWLLLKINNDGAESRMKSCVNLLCSSELQSQVKWSNIVGLKNFLNVFKIVGKTPLEHVTLNSVDNFIRKHLAFCKRRAVASSNPTCDQAAVSDVAIQQVDSSFSVNENSEYIEVNRRLEEAEITMYETDVIMSLSDLNNEFKK